MSHHVRITLIAVFFSILPTLLAGQLQCETLPVRFDRGRRIIVEGTANDIVRARMMIDTGSTCSVLNSRFAKGLTLRRLQNRLAFNSNDRVVYSPLIALPSIELGSIRRPLACLMAELPVDGIDLLIGRDVLRSVCFTVDYEAQLIHFGPKAALEHRISFDAAGLEIIVPLQVGNHEVLVKIDSGADGLYLFEDRATSSWLRVDRNLFGFRIRHLSSERKGMKISLESVRLGAIDLGRINAVILQSNPGGESGRRDWHGLLGLSVLNAKRVQFDFPNGLFSWE
jgi:predicted aspartyl protease